FDYAHAADLVEELKTRGDFCIGGACYPEGHPESESLEKDIYYMAQKYGGTPDMGKAGIEFSVKQINALIKEGVKHIHIYTMNDPEVAMEIHQNISEIIR
ncbi:MAG: methylenetetrahydrofolate reductase, partial [Firmicutes bacterium]|nr:methylenetetrahydrofolate reductase [Bacillota bacterium]